LQNFKKKFLNIFIAYFFSKAEKLYQQYPGFPAELWYLNKLGWANTPLVLIHFQLSLDATFKQSAV
jgi:hypothetical protein